MRRSVDNVELERSTDPRLVPFLIAVLGNPTEPVEVRIASIRRLRNRQLNPAEQPLVAQALVGALAEAEQPDLRLEALLALGDFTDKLSVQTALGSLALRLSEPVDLRYTAFTSLQRAGPMPVTVQLFRQLAADEILGPSARSVLRLWRVV